MNPIYSRRLDYFKQAYQAFVEQLEVESKIGVKVEPNIELEITPNLATKSRRLDRFKELIRYYEKHWAFFDRYQEPFPKRLYVKNKAGPIVLPEITPDNIDIVYQWAFHIRKSAFDGYDAQTVDGETKWIRDPLTHYRYNGVTEVNEWIDTSQSNPDIPDAIHGFEQGWLEQRHSEHLDHRGLDDRDFRQRCVVYNNRLHVLYHKQKVDFKLPQHLDPNWIRKKLSCPIEPAMEIARGFTALSIHRKFALKMIFEVPKMGSWRAVFGYPRPLDAFILAKQLTEMADATDEVTVRWQNCINSDDIERELLQTSGIGHRPDSPFLYEMEYCLDDENWNDDETLGSWTWTDKQFETVFPDDDIEGKEENPFGAHPLYHGNEAVSHEFITMLRFASHEKLQSVIDELPKRKDGQHINGRWEFSQTYGRYWKKYKFHYLTDSQISQIWIYIKARRQELKELAKGRLSPDARIIIDYMNQNGRKNIANAMIYKWRDNQPFNLYGVALNWIAKPHPTELSIVWDRWHKME